MLLSTTAQRALTVPASTQTVWAVIADVPDSVAHFAGLAAFEAAGPDTWRWRLTPIGAGQLRLQTVYTCRYTVDRGAQTVSWVAAPDPAANARVSGAWTLRPEGAGARLDLVNHLAIDIGLPRVLRRPAEALVTRENSRLIDRYLANLAITLGGGDGRVR